MVPNSTEEQKQLSPAEALELLKAGNRRFIAGEGLYPHHRKHAGPTAIKPQKPVACILGCSDSRVPPQLLFDQQVGGLFMVRVAGNILDSLVLASIEYAVLVLNTPLVLVLGHQSCGAVLAARDQDHFEGHLGALIQQIKPVFGRCKDPNDVDEAVRLNIQEVTHKLRHEPVLKEKISSGVLDVTGSYYDLERGLIDFMEPLH